MRRINHSSRFIELFRDGSYQNVPLGDLCTKITDGSHNPPKGVDESEFMMISSQNVFSDGLDLSDVRFLSKEDFENEDKRTSISKGDVLLTIVGTIGRVYQVTGTEGPIALQRSVAVLKPNDKITSRFLMLSFLYDDDFSKEGRGNAQKGVYLKQLSQYMIKLPSTEKQRAFEVIYQQADKSKFSDFKSRFIEMFGDPFKNEKGWGYYSLSKVTTIVLGTTPSSSNPDYWDGDIKWITPAELNDDSFYVYDSERHITEAGVRSTALKPFPAGTVIFSTRAPIGKTAIAGCEMYCNQGFKNFICSDKLNPVYLFYTLKSHKEELQKMGTGSTFLELSKKTIEGLSISIPPRELQDEFEVIYKQADKSKYLN